MGNTGRTWFKRGHKINKGRKWSKKSKEKLSKSLTGRKFSKEHIKNLSGKNNHFFGKHHSKETKLKISESRKGKIVGNKAHNWKGDAVKYRALHEWVVRHKGKAKKCIDCETIKGKIEYSNIDHKYRRVLSDYQPRCTPCHRKYDYERRFV